MVIVNSLPVWSRGIVIAEGVETDVERDLCAEEGFDCSKVICSHIPLAGTPSCPGSDSTWLATEAFRQRPSRLGCRFSWNESAAWEGTEVYPPFSSILSRHQPLEPNR